MTLRSARSSYHHYTNHGHHVSHRRNRVSHIYLFLWVQRRPIGRDRCAIHDSSDEIHDDHDWCNDDMMTLLIFAPVIIVVTSPPSSSISTRSLRSQRNESCVGGLYLGVVLASSAALAPGVLARHRRELPPSDRQELLREGQMAGKGGSHVGRQARMNLRESKEHPENRAQSSSSSREESGSTGTTKDIATQRYQEAAEEHK